MASSSNIEWTGATWNVITGCSIISPGCRDCYAMKLAGTRLRKHPSRAGLTRHVGGRHAWTGEVRFNEQWLRQPLEWKKPRAIFVCAHGDLFHEDVPDAWIDRVVGVMALAEQHCFQVLTKRAARMREYCSRLAAHQYQVYGRRWPLPNVWWGVSAERQIEANERIPHLLETPAAMRWVSLEPLIGSIDLMMLEHGARAYDAVQGFKAFRDGDSWEHEGKCPALDWVVVGGESSSRARPYRLEWDFAIEQQCREAGVAFFRKQLGSNPIGLDGAPLVLKNRKGGDWDEWPEAMRVREMPAALHRLPPAAKVA